MLTFKKFLEADAMSMSPQPDSPNKQLKGTLSENGQRVLAILSHNQIKSSPGLARQIISGDRSLVEAVRILKQNFKAVDVTRDGVVINQTGISLAQSHGVVDPNSGELTAMGNKLASTLSSGAKNPKMADIISQPTAPQMGDPMGGPAVGPSPGAGLPV